MHCGGHYYTRIRSKKKQRKTYNFKISILYSWFSQTHAKLDVVCQLIAYFLYINVPRLRLLMTECKISLPTAIDWTNFCREVNLLIYSCITWFFFILNVNDLTVISTMDYR